MEANTDTHPDKIFVRHGLTEFEKLLFAESYIKQLEREKKELLFKMGQMASYQEEAQDIIEGKKKLSDDERIAIKRDTYVQELLLNIKSLTASNENLKKEISKMIVELVKYKHKI